MNLRTMDLDLEEFVFVMAVLINYFGQDIMAAKWQVPVYM